ncbi:MAG: hypothetical protein Q4F24_11165 [Eubacteriales bacterium]|nr:hypothetical protein [Eubacteriales bacterium]
MEILISVFSLGYHGKTIDFEKYSPCHRTSVTHFLNKGKWDDITSSKTKPSLRALHPIKDAYFHQYHLKRKQDYRHQAVAIMPSCKRIVLNYALVMYDKSMLKVKIVQEIAKELPIPPVVSYFLCGSWYPYGIKQKVSEFAPHLRKTDAAVNLVTVGNRRYYVYRYEDDFISSTSVKQGTFFLMIFWH